MKTKNKIQGSLMSGALALSISAVIVKIIGVIYKVPLTYMLGDTGMGYFNSAYTIYGFFHVIASAGVPKAVAILTAEANTAGRKGEAREIYRRMLQVFFMLGSVLTLVFVALAKPLAVLVGNNKAYITMLAIAPSIVFIAISGVSRGYLNGHSRLAPIAISQLVESVAKLVLGLIFAYIGIHLSLPISIVSALTILGITLGSFFSMIYLYISSFSQNVAEKQGQKLHLQTKKLIPRMLKIALPITLSASVLSLSNIIDLGLIMRGLRNIGYTEEAAGALYGNYTTLAVPMLNLVVSVLSPISVALLPRLVEDNASRDTNAFNIHFLSGMKATMLLAVPCAFAFFLYPFDLLDILFDSTAAAVGAPTLMLIAPSVLFLPYLTMLNTALEAEGMAVKSTLALFVGAIAKSIVTLLLLPRIGIYAAPIGTALSYLVSIIISSSFLRSLSLGSPFSSLLLDIVTCTLVFLPPYLLIYATGAIGTGEVAAIVSLIISFILYFVVIWVISYLKGKARLQVKLHKNATV